MRVVFVFNAEFSKSSIPHQELAYSSLGGIPPRLGTPVLEGRAHSSASEKRNFTAWTALKVGSASEMYIPLSVSGGATHATDVRLSVTRSSGAFEPWPWCGILKIDTFKEITKES